MKTPRDSYDGYWNNGDQEPRFKGRRIENLGDNVKEWCDATGGGSSTYDLCDDCAAVLDIAPLIYSDVLIPYNNGEPFGSIGWGGDVDHPNYDGLWYRCRIPTCRVLLGE